MTSLDAVRARFAHNDGLPFAEILTDPAFPLAGASGLNNPG